MAILLPEASRVIVQGMTGSEGMKHTTRMLAAGKQVVGGVNPRRAGESVTFGGGVEVPAFGTVTEAMAATGADVSVVFVPPTPTPTPTPDEDEDVAEEPPPPPPFESPAGLGVFGVDAVLTAGW